MRGKDRAVVAMILAVALVVGLVLVQRALTRAEAAQQALLYQAQADAAGSAWNQLGTDAPEENLAAIPGRTAGRTDSVSPHTDGAAEGDAAGQGGEAEESVGKGDLSSETAAQQTAVSMGAEDIPIPSLGPGSYSPETLSAWMKNESGGALATQAEKSAEEALASGAGAENDPLRRTFAQSQTEPNNEARKNLLEEQAATLSGTYLRCREMVVLQEENKTFYKALLEAIQAAHKTDDGKDALKTALLQLNADTAAAALAAAELTAAEAQKELDTAARDINAAVGNEVAADMKITGALTRAALPELTEEAAVLRALAQRNEIKVTDYAVRCEKQTLERLRYHYPVTAPEYLKQQSVLVQARADAAKAKTEVEADVRNRFSNLTLATQLLDATEKKLDNSGRIAPEELYALQNSGGVWVSNADELTARWAEIMGSRASCIAQTAQLNLDILYMKHAVGVGCMAAPI